MLWQGEDVQLRFFLGFALAFGAAPSAAAQCMLCAQDKAAGARRVRGDVVDLGGFALTGTVTVRGEPGAEVRVILPASIDLDSGHGRTARVTGLVTDLSAAPRLGADGRLIFRFGGRLQIAGLDDGDYRGRIPVTVEYQ